MLFRISESLKVIFIYYGNYFTIISCLVKFNENTTLRILKDLNTASRIFLKFKSGQRKYFITSEAVTYMVYRYEGKKGDPM